MSFELYVDGKPKGQVASMGGMADLTEAYSFLNSELGHFLDIGYSKSPVSLRKAIETVIVDDQGNMSEANRRTLQSLLRRLPDKGTVSLSSD